MIRGEPMTMLRSMAYAAAALLAVVSLAGCGEEESWPDHEPLVQEYQEPSAPLEKETFNQMWSELSDSFDLRAALGDIPGLQEKVLQALCPDSIPCTPEVLLAVSADSKTTLACQLNGKLVIETRGDEDGLVQRARFHAQECGYNVQIGDKFFPQTLDGDLWVTVYGTGEVLLVLDGTIRINDKELTLVFDFAYANGLWKFKLDVGDKHLVAVVEPEAGLAGVLQFEASNGQFECQVDGAKLHCEDLDSDAYLDLSLPK
jgi:hypothetical protein